MGLHKSSIIYFESQRHNYNKSEKSLDKQFHDFMQNINKAI